MTMRSEARVGVDGQEEVEMLALQAVSARARLLRGLHDESTAEGALLADADRRLLAREDVRQVLSQVDARPRKAFGEPVTPKSEYGDTSRLGEASRWMWSDKEIPKSLLCFAWRQLPLLRTCESPPEVRFLLAMVSSDEGRSARLPNREGAPTLLFAPDGRSHLRLDGQATIGRHRVDFLLTGSSSRRVAVEVDGFAFHERTQEQAERDRARDRELLAAGVVTVRFMAKAIFADDLKCADEAFNIALNECVPFVLKEEAA